MIASQEKSAPHFQRLAKQIKAARNRLGLSQQALAIQLGSSVSAVSKWEQGISTPELQYFVTLVRMLKENAGPVLEAAHLSPALALSGSHQPVKAPESITTLYLSYREALETLYRAAAAGDPLAIDRLHSGAEELQKLKEILEKVGGGGNSKEVTSACLIDPANELKPLQPTGTPEVEHAINEAQMALQRLCRLKLRPARRKPGAFSIASITI